MLVISPVHRRLAELHIAIKQRGLTYSEQLELVHCLQVNADLVRKIDELKQLAYVAQLSGDMEWVQEICAKIEEVEATIM